MAEGKLVTIPIFYIVETDTVKYQKGELGDALRKKEREVGDEQIKKWEKAFKSVCNYIGFTFDGKRYNCLPSS
ncbi:putative disease resistance protein [Cardamine amara subsp. amara]|uniref:Disease resistance protein n=1 Tax=Cardamine amara subsp. amara TaxID=228776 RepID=A0ABD0ZKC5_CARAN